MPKAPRVALVTSAEIPELTADDQLLLHALRHRGIDAAPVVWSDPAIPWAAVELTVMRSAWDAIHRYAEFLGWVERIAALTKLWNPAPLLTWNSHKGYLLDLAARGVPVVPTVLVSQGSPASLGDIQAEHGWTAAVVKPAVSASAFGTFLAQPTTLVQAQTHLEAYLSTRDMLVQPYLPAVADYGERALVFIAGVFSHAGRKTPAITPDAPLGHDTHTREQVAPAPDELSLAAHVLAELGHPTLYARLDTVRDTQGNAIIMEVEVIDPALYLHFAPNAVTRLADAIAEKLG